MPRLDHLGVEFHLGLGHDAKHRLGCAGRVAPNASHAAADEAIGRRCHFHTPPPPHELTPLGVHLRLLCLREIQAVLGRG